MNQLIDLHIHSTASDGIYKPAELVHIAHQSGLSTIAIADHDSTDGIDEAISAGQQLGLNVIPAVELSVAYQGYQDVHLLGYWINHHDTAFCAKLNMFRQRRASRGIRIIDRINEKLLSEGKSSISSAEVLARADGALGRPHIARVLIDHGHAQNMQEAFANYLMPCNVPKEYFNFADALAEIKRVGGIAILAHPQSITRNRSELTTVITDMAAMGLDGIEALNTMGVEDDDAFLQRLAKHLGMMVTGGSDFHGSEEEVTMGRGRGNLYLTSVILESMIDKIGTGKEKSPGA